MPVKRHFDLLERPDTECYGEWALGPLAYSPFHFAWLWLAAGAAALITELLGMPVWRLLAFAAFLLLVVPYAYRFLYNRSFVLYMDETGVWVYQGILPWNRGVYGEKWQDIARVDHRPSFSSWITRSYAVMVTDRFNEDRNLYLPDVWRGNHAASDISAKLLEITERDAQAGRGAIPGEALASDGPPADVFPLLINHLQHAKQLMPKYMGKFNGTGSLPRGRYPPIYWWEDTSIDKLRLSFNTPLLEDTCAQLATESGISVDDAAIKDALDKLREVSSHAFEAMMRTTVGKSAGTPPEPRRRV